MHYLVPITTEAVWYGLFIFTVAHNCHGKLKFTTANLKFEFTTANSNSPRQIQIRHGKFKFTTANLKFTTANSISSRQIQIRHGKFKFTTANSKSLLTVRFATGVGLVLGGFGLVLVVRASFCGGGVFGAYWVLEVADLGPLPLLVGMGDPWISGLPCVVWLWPLVGGKDFLCHALWSSFVPGVNGVLPLSMVETGWQMGASGAGGPFVY